MNNVSLMGRLTADPDIREANELTVARFTLAVDRPGSADADFIRIVAFGKTAEFAEDYLAKGQRIALIGHIVTGSYENKEGQKVYTTDIAAERIYFADIKKQQPADEPEKPERGKKDDQRNRRR